MGNMIYDYMELMHYGVKGMKWGVRRTPEQLRHDRDKLLEKKYGTVIDNEIRSGRVSPNLHQGRQDKHIVGSNNYIKGRSYVYRYFDVEAMVSDLMMTGEPLIPNGKRWVNKEYVESSRPIGVYIDQQTGRRHKTNRAQIHYSKAGTHIVPASPKANGDE